MQSILAKDEELDKGNKQFEDEVLRLLTGSDTTLFDEDLLKNISFGVMFTAKDLKAVIRAQNSFKQQVVDLERTSSELSKSLQTLKDDLKVELEKEAPNIEQITQKIVKERLEEEKKKYEYEREQLLRDLQNRVEKVLKLEVELDEVKDGYRALESTLSKDEQQYKQRAIKLERSLEQITGMYQTVINDKSILKVDL